MKGTNGSPPIVVTGATGNTGATLARLLREHGARVRALVRSREKAAALFGEGVEIHDGFDYDRPETAARAFAGVEKVYLLSTYEPRAVEQTKGLIDGAKRAGVRHIVRLSLFGCDDPLKGFGACESGRQHRELDDYVRGGGFTYTLLRPTYFYQNLPWQHRDQLRNNFLSSPFGPHAPVNFIDTRDIAEVASIVLTNDGHENRVYELTGPQSLSMTEIAGLISRLTGRAIRFVDMNDEETKAWLVGFGIAPERAAGLIHMYGQTRAGNTADITDDFGRVTGHKGASIEQYINDNLKAFLPKAL